MDVGTRLFWGVLALLLALSAFYATGAERKRRALEGSQNVTVQVAR